MLSLSIIKISRRSHLSNEKNHFAFFASLADSSRVNATTLFTVIESLCVKQYERNAECENFMLLDSEQGKECVAK